VNITKRLKVRGLYLVGLCLVSVFAFGAAGSASAASLLFVPSSGTFPYHFVGSSGESQLNPLSTSNPSVKSQKSDVLVLVKTSTLFNTHIDFLESTSNSEPCGSTAATSGTISVDLEGHLGFADPGVVPAVLLLVPGHITFKCRVLGSIEVPTLIRGGIIGRITAPALNTSSELLLISFKQAAKGVQEFSTFLLGNELLLNEMEQVSINKGAFELSSQVGHVTLHALVGQGTFQLVSP
jgi:hypothetical protein